MLRSCGLTCGAVGEVAFETIHVLELTLRNNLEYNCDDPVFDKMTRFVVVTPVLNCATYIEATLKSVAAQTDPDWVHYLVDGGSTDGTLELLEKAADDDSRRRIITGRDASIYDALFKGFDRALADGFGDTRSICVWLNGDDLLMPWAFARLRQAFDETGAEWVTAVPAFWDAAGNLALIRPYNWHPRWLIRAGQFNGRSLGFIQQESTFFTRSLLSKLSDPTVADIRAQKLAGDFLLWREFAKYTRPTPVMTAVGGFRKHNANASVAHMDRYFAEIEEAGVWLPPPWLGRVFRTIWRRVALLASERLFVRDSHRFDVAISKPKSTP